MFGQQTYLYLELLWGLPILGIEWLFGARELLRRWRLVTGCAGLATLYLCVADDLAIHAGIWHLSIERTTGLAIAGLPIEEAIFFAVTNLMVVQGFVLFAETDTRRLPLVAWLLRRGRSGG